MVSNNRNDNETKNPDAGDWGFFVDIDLENQNQTNLDNKKMVGKCNMTNKKLNSPFEDILEEYEYYSYQQNKLVDLEENKMNHEMTRCCLHNNICYNIFITLSLLYFIFCII
jgi:hypothetical protein